MQARNFPAEIREGGPCYGKARRSGTPYIRILSGMDTKRKIPAIFCFGLVYCTRTSVPIIWIISWSDSSPIAFNAITSGQSFSRLLCCKKNCPFLNLTMVRVLFRDVDEVTDATPCPFSSSSTMILFLDNCSWISTTRSFPFVTK